MAPTAQRIIPLRAYWEIERAEGGNRTTAWILTQHLYKKRKEKTIGQTQSYEGGHMESRKQRTSPTHQNNAIFLSPSRAPNTVQRSTHVSTVKTIIESSFIYIYVRTYVRMYVFSRVRTIMCPEDPNSDGTWPVWICVYDSLALMGINLFFSWVYLIYKIHCKNRV